MQKTLNLKIILLLLVILLYLKYLTTNIYNVPFWDDWDSCLDFLNNYLQANDFSTKISLLLKQHNEHIILFTHLIQLLQLKLFGTVNFIYLVIFTNIILFLIIIFLLQYIKSNICLLDKLLIILPLLLNPLQFENQLWLGAGLQQYTQILCAVIAMQLLVKIIEKPQKYYSFLLYGLLIGNSFVGGGFIALYLSFIVILWSLKEYRHLIILISIFVINSVFIFKVLPYKFMSHEYAKLSSYIGSFLSFSGDLLPFGKVAALIGVLYISSYIICYKKFSKNKSIWVWMNFFWVTAALIMLSRSQFGGNQANSRYATYALITTSMFICTILQSEKVSKRIKEVILYLPTLYFIVMLLSVTHIGYLKPEQSYLSWHRSDALSGHLNYPDQARAKQIYLESRHLGIYQNDEIDQYLKNN